MWLRRPRALPYRKQFEVTCANGLNHRFPTFRPRLYVRLWQGPRDLLNLNITVRTPSVASIAILATSGFL